MLIRFGSACASRVRKSVVALALAPSVALSQPTALPELPTPKSATWLWLAANMRMNGAPMQIREVDAPLDAEATTEFYREWFRQNADRNGLFAENPTPVGALLGAEVDGKYVTVEILPAAPKRTVARVSAMDMKQAKRPNTLAKDVPRMMGSEVLQVQESDDGLKTNRTIILQNNHSPESNTLFYREQLIAHGWQKLRDEAIRPGVQRTLMMRKGAVDAQFHVTRDGDRTTVVATYTDGAPKR